MTVRDGFRPGIDTLLSHHRDWLKARRIGLVSHMAAVDGEGRSTAERLSTDPDCTLVNLMGPEHGYFGNAPAGAHVDARRHPTLGIPVHSLYGATRKPSADMLAGIDTIVFDIQDLGIRCYTYVSTLRLVLESAAEFGKTVIVADRPIPHPNTIDGPMLDPKLESFVGSLPLPFVYGMTPGEAARWIVDTLALDVELRVAPMQDYHRHPGREQHPLPWIPPSPGIVSWESATCYPATVFGEALPAVDHGRCTGLPFQLLGAEWIDGVTLAETLSEQDLPGTCWHTHPYYLMTGDRKGQLAGGVRLTITDANTFRPIETCVAILDTLRTLHGEKTLWHHKGVRHDFFDSLFGDTALREALMSAQAPDAITKGWQHDLTAFDAGRQKALLYHGPAT